MLHPRSWILTALALLGAMNVMAPGETVSPTSGMRITSDITFAPGEYRIDAPIVIAADTVTVDFGGATLLGADAGALPDTFSGTAIVIEAKKNVVLKNAVLRGFKVGIHAKQCVNLRVEGCDVSRNYRQRLRSTPQREDPSDWLWPHHNDEGEWATRYGGGIVLDGCDQSRVLDNRGRHTQNGILLSNTNNTYIYDNDMSFNSGWGIALWRSSNNSITRNRFDYCVRGYSHGVYHRGQDSAGILVFEQCNQNIIAYNSATHSGDGLFLYAGHETTQKTGKGGCNENLVYANDFSHAVANGIEATFSFKNRFIENFLDECDYGIWAGYSQRSNFVANRISRSLTAGIAIEHGVTNWIEGNLLEDNPRGVWLWWDSDEELITSAFGKNNQTSSRDCNIGFNRFLRCKVGVELDLTDEVIINRSEFRDTEVALSVKSECKEVYFAQSNVFGPDCVFVRNLSETPISYGSNHVESEVIQGAVTEILEPLDQPMVINQQEIMRGIGNEPMLTGRQYPFLPKDAIRGRSTMIIGEWGPLDPSVKGVHPATARGMSNARFHVLGNRAPWKVGSVTGAVEVESSANLTPALLTVTPTRPGLVPFAVEVAIEDLVFTATGECMSTTWDVSYFMWEPAGAHQPPADWQKTISGEPLVSVRTSQLDHVWASGRPAEGVPADYFATVATTTLELPAGRYQVGTVSDDGIRVILDGKTVVEDWTWHAPKQDDAEVELQEGAHTIRVEHFEIDGFAQLTFWIRPL